MRYLNNGLEADKMYQSDDVCLPGALLQNHQAVKLPGTWVGSSAGRQWLIGMFADYSKSQLRPQANALRIFLECRENERILKKISWRTIVLSTPVITNSTRITIGSNYYGNKYTDTVISDVSFDAYVLH